MRERVSWGLDDGMRWEGKVGWVREEDVFFGGWGWGLGFGFEGGRGMYISLFPS